MGTTGQLGIDLSRLANIQLAVAATGVELSVEVSDLLAFAADLAQTTAEFGRPLSDTATGVDSSQTTGDFGRPLSDALALTEVALLSREINVGLTDTISFLDAYVQSQLTLNDTVGLTDSAGLTVERSPFDSLILSQSISARISHTFSVTSDNTLLRITLPTGLDVESVIEPNHYRIHPGLDAVPVGVLSIVPITDALEGGVDAQILDARTVRLPGTSLSGEETYLHLSTPLNPVSYARVVDVIFPDTVILDQDLVVTDPIGLAGQAAYVLTTAVIGMSITTTKPTSGRPYVFEANVLSFAGERIPLMYEYTAVAPRPEVTGVEFLDEGQIVVTFSEPMRNERDLVDPSLWLVEGPTDVDVLRIFPIADDQICLETLGMGDGTYTLSKGPVTVTRLQDTLVVEERGIVGLECALLFSDVIVLDATGYLETDLGAFDLLSAMDDVVLGGNVSFAPDDALLVSDGSTHDVEYARDLLDTTNLDDIHKTEMDAATFVNDTAEVSDETQREAEFETFSTDDADATDEGIRQVEFETSSADVLAVTDLSFPAFEYETTGTDASATSDDITIDLIAAAFPLFEADFNALTVGPKTQANFLTDTGMLYQRSYASTIQTSASTLYDAAGPDEACIGSLTNAAGVGLSLQCTTTEIPATGTADYGSQRTFALWGTPTATKTTGYADSPNQLVTGCTRFNASSGQYSSYGDALVAANKYCVTYWQRSKDAATNGSMQSVLSEATITANAEIALRAASNTWARVEARSDGVSGLLAQVPVDARDWAVAGGQTAMARDVLVDYASTVRGEFPPEVVVGTAVANSYYRIADTVSVSSVIWNNLITALGRLRFYSKMVTKFASTNEVWAYSVGGSSWALSTRLFLFSSKDAYTTCYAHLRSDKKVAVRLAATGGGEAEVVSTSAAVFARGDTVEWNIDVGSNVASVCKYRVNGGAWVDLGLPTIVSAPPTAGGSSLASVCSGPFQFDGTFPCWLQEVQFLDDGSAVP